MTTRQRAEAQASDQLTQALVRAAARGDRPRCADGEVSYMFLDESPQTRAIASTYCSGCIIWQECDEVGKHQRFGVWGGVDRTRSPGRKRDAA